MISCRNYFFSGSQYSDPGEQFWKKHTSPKHVFLICFFFKSTSQVRDRYPLSGVRQMQDIIPHLPDPTEGVSISHLRTIFEETHRKSNIKKVTCHKNQIPGSELGRRGSV